MSPATKSLSPDALMLQEFPLPGHSMAVEIDVVVREALKTILVRQREDYPYIDTKFSPVTGEDFREADVLRGFETVYTWIQGRGLEALAGHERWLAGKREGADLRGKIRSILQRVSDRMESLRQDGHLSFFMTKEGTPLRLDESGALVEGEIPQEGNLADLFYAKGLAASAVSLGDRQKLETAEVLFDQVILALRQGTFRSGQVAFDPKNPVSEVTGRISQGPWMIAIGGATVFLCCTGKARYAELGRELIEHVLSRHAQAEEGLFRPGDFWEFVDAQGAPWENGGRVWSDPGHATEFAGLALAHLAADPREEDNALREVLRLVLVRNFRNGFSGRGIVKAFDLVRRETINTDQPWWSLPETMRAAALSRVHAQTEAKDEMEGILASCWNAFRDHYLRPECGYFAVQCLDEQGKVSSAIPATPDLDPGYHTGLSLLSVLQTYNSPESRREP